MKVYFFCSGRNVHCFFHITDAPNVTSFQRANSTTNFTLNCTSTNSPATNVTWLRNGNTLQANEAKNRFYQSVTSRQNSTYQNTLVVDDVIENVIGNYTCNVTNRFGNSNSTLTIRGKLIAYLYLVAIQFILNSFFVVVVVCFFLFVCLFVFCCFFVLFLGGGMWGEASIVRSLLSRVIPPLFLPPSQTTAISTAFSSSLLWH